MITILSLYLQYTFSIPFVMFMLSITFGATQEVVYLPLYK